MAVPEFLLVLEHLFDAHSQVFQTFRISIALNSLSLTQTNPNYPPWWFCDKLIQNRAMQALGPQRTVSELIPYVVQALTVKRCKKMKVPRQLVPSTLLCAGRSGGAPVQR